MDSKLKEKIKAIIAEAQEEDHHGNLLMYSGEAADLIFSLLAPELEKARKWDRIKEIAKRNELDSYPCEGCSVESMCDSTLSLCGQADTLAEALEALTEKETT